MNKVIFILACVSLGSNPALAEALTTRYPWIVKSQTDLSFSECKAAMRHDSNYWWSRGSCHMKFIRYAAGVAIRDAVSDDDTGGLSKGQLLTAITQYRPTEKLYCEHGGSCFHKKDVKLLGSILTGPYSDYKSGDETDMWQGVSTSCELILADRRNILAASAQELLRGCH